MLGLCYLIPQNFLTADVTTLPATYTRVVTRNSFDFDYFSLVDYAMTGGGISVHYTKQVNMRCIVLNLPIF